MITGLIACRKVLDKAKADTKVVEKYKSITRLHNHGSCKTDEDLERVRWLLAGNPNTPSTVLDKLSRNDSSLLLERIADNPQTSPDTLARLAIHDDPRIRAAVAENPRMTEVTMWRLASDAHPDVRLRLAESYFLPPAILQALAEDDNPYVQSRANKTINRLNQPLSVSLSMGCC